MSISTELKKSKYGLTPVFLMNWYAVNKRNPDGSRKYKYIINTGSSRSSKTFSLIETMHRLCEQNEGWRVTAWRETKKACKDTVWKDFQKVLRLSDRLDVNRRNKTESYYSYPNDSMFEIHGTDDEESVHGLTQNVAWLNEPYKTSLDTFDQIDMRSDIVFIDWNPKKGSFIDKLIKRDNAIVIPSTYKDNTFCPPKQKEKIESYQPVHMCSIFYNIFANNGGNKDMAHQGCMSYDIKENPNKYSEEQVKELKRCIKNENPATRTANEYKWTVYGLGLKAERPNKIFTNWEEIELNEFLALPYDSYYGLDFGLANPSAIVEVKYNDGTFYINERLYKPEREMQEGLVQELESIGIDKKTPMFCDYASPDKIRELRMAGFNAFPCLSKKVFDGISFMQRARIVYTRTSKNIEAEYDEYEWDTDRLGVIDSPVKAQDHILDALRYIMMYLQVKLKITL